MILTSQLQSRSRNSYRMELAGRGLAATGSGQGEHSTLEGSNRTEHDILRGKRVVIVEDEGVTQMQLRRALSRAGLNVVGSAANGREAVTVVLQERPDLVLMDIRMPVMDGLQALDNIMEQYRVCVVMLTAFADEANRGDAQAKGASGYIVKPVTGDVLIPQLILAYNTFERGRS